MAEIEKERGMVEMIRWCEETDRQTDRQLTYLRADTVTHPQTSHTA